MSQKDSNARKALESVRVKVAPNLDAGLLTAVYEANHKLQYERDSDIALRRTQKLVESHVDKALTSDTARGE